MKSKVDEALASIDISRDAESEIARLQERVKALQRIAPLGIPLELMAGYDGLELYVAESPKHPKHALNFPK